MNNKKVTEIHKDLLRISKPYGTLVLAYDCLPIIKKASRIKDDDKTKRAGLLLPLLGLYYSQLNKPINDIVVKDRETAIEKMMDIAAESGRIFFLCSRHGDCAKDHLDYQGKMYYSSTRTQTDEEREYITKHNLNSVEWVMGDPVYLLTRPHCRHYFVVLESKEVLNASVEELLHRYKMISPKGHRRPQNIIYAKTYQERLLFHKELQKIQNSPELEAKISKDKELINKWKNK